MRSNVFDAQFEDVASSELAVDGQVKHGQVARSPELQFGSDRPVVLRPTGGLAPFFQGPRRDCSQTHTWSHVLSWRTIRASISK
jgi:hypothetical protein